MLYVFGVCIIFDNFKLELIGTNAYILHTSLSGKIVVDGHGYHTALQFGIKAEEKPDNIPTLF